MAESNGEGGESVEGTTEGLLVAQKEWTGLTGLLELRGPGR